MSLVRNLIENPFDKSNFETFLKNIFESADFENRFPVDLNKYSKKFKEVVKEAEVLGAYNDGKDKILFLTVELYKEQTLQRARTIQRDFVAEVLKDYGFDGGLVAFYQKDSDFWKLSLVKVEYRYDESGKVKKFKTSPKRFSFIVGKDKASRTTLLQLEKLLNLETKSLDSLLEVFSVEKLNEEFFKSYLVYFKKL
ncbi:MAG: class I SAM-dependent DNA methyltransferase, partial [Desulfurobacteriaceae bacterium]